MITAASIHNVDGTHNCDINTDIIPLHDFDVTPVLRTNTGRQKSQQPGRWPTWSTRDGYEIHMEGDIFGTSSADYFANRQTLIVALFGVPGATPVLTDRKFGTFHVTFDGSTEEWLADFTITAWSAPLNGDSPSRSAFAVTLETWDPWFVGASTSTKYFYS
jgi:hypothetical protein